MGHLGGSRAWGCKWVWACVEQKQKKGGSAAHEYGLRSTFPGRILSLVTAHGFGRERCLSCLAKGTELGRVLPRALSWVTDNLPA